MHTLIMVSALLIASSAAHAQERLLGDDDRILTFALENDLFNGHDDGYTSGVRLGLLSRENTMPEWVRNITDGLPLIESGSHRRFGMSLGQNIYTPNDTESAALVLNDQPYAGWLYASFGLISDTGKTLDTYQLTLGMAGPSAAGKVAQRTIHDLRGFDSPNGWHHQLRDEPGIILTYDHKWKSFYRESPFGLAFDATPQWGFNLGNIHTNATTGITFRLGMDLPEDYGPPLIQPSLAGSDFFIPTDALGWYLFAGVDGQAVARNIFLDGNSWKDSHNVDKKPFVGGLQAGAAVTYENIRLAYTYAVRSKEFDGQDSRNAYSALTLSWRF